MAWAPSIYATEGELTAHARIGDQVDDAQVFTALAAASRAIDQRCNRQFGRVPVVEARDYVPRWSRARGGWLVPIDDLMTTTGLVVAVDQDGDGVHETVSTSYRLRPSNAVAKGQPWTELLLPAAAAGARTPYSVRVTALWGWPGVPDAVRQACLLQASRLLARRDAPFGIAGSPESGSELRLLSRLDPDVAVAVEPYRRRVWAA
jgi:hypothetical protein